jgi:predicted PhzF superfamily epimerase YddE/YHI9
MRSLRYVFADVFTDRPLERNQLAVFSDARTLDDETMQALALEIGFSETVFVLPPEQGGTVRIRIFTPRAELPFAGHPILGAAWVLAAPLQRDVLELETGRGIVPVELERDESGAIAFGRSGGPRRCSRWPRERTAPSSGSRAAVAPSSSRAASSGLASREELGDGRRCCARGLDRLATVRAGGEIGG